MTEKNEFEMQIGSQYKADGIWSEPDGDILIEIKRTSNVRDIRSALLELAYLLSNGPDTNRAICVLTQSKLSKKRINEELDRFRWLVRREIGERIELTSFEDLVRSQSSSKIGNAPAFILWITDLVSREVSGSRTSRQTVMSAMALFWLRNTGPMTTKSLQEKCGASDPTVAAAISDLSKLDLIDQGSDRRVSLRSLPTDRWVKMVQKHVEGRKVHRYIDPTGQMRSPEVLMTRLFKLQQQGVAQEVGVGGVIGARRFYPDIDITASPRLDLSVYGESNLEFVRQLDAALEQTTDSRTKAHVIVHVTTESECFLEKDGHGSWASEMECAADLMELGLVHEVQEMFETLRPQPNSNRGNEKQ